MDYAAVDSLRRTHPAWRLLLADHAQLIVSFLHAAFSSPIRSLPEQELASKLEDRLFHLREQLGEKAFPHTALQYLESWASDPSDQHAWLRRYYAVDRDEPWFDVTPSAEKAIAPVVALEQRQFVGTESRLRIVFELASSTSSTRTARSRRSTSRGATRSPAPRSSNEHDGPRRGTVVE